MDENLTWEGHIEHICKKLASANFAINSSKNFLPHKIRKNIYFSLFDCHLNFGNILWGCAANKLIKKVDTLQKKCIRNVSLKKYNAHSEPIFKELGILKNSDKSHTVRQYSCVNIGIRNVQYPLNICSLR